MKLILSNIIHPVARNFLIFVLVYEREGGSTEAHLCEGQMTNFQGWLLFFHFVLRLPLFFSLCPLSHTTS